MSKYNVVKAYLLADPLRKPLPVIQDKAGGVSVALPPKAPGEIASVLCLEIEGASVAR